MTPPRRLFRARRHLPSYAAAVAAVARAANLPPGVHQVVIEHDPACQRPQGKPCTCRPDVRLVQPLALAASTGLSTDPTRN